VKLAGSRTVIDDPKTESSPPATHTVTRDFVIPVEARAEILLSREADRVLGPQTFDDQLRKQDADLRKWMADRVVPAFLKANGLTLAALAVLVVLDEINIACHLIAPGDRIITEKVIMALLGATTVQVGVIAALIARYLFPSRPA
jgi:hypothetical protein